MPRIAACLTLHVRDPGLFAGKGCVVTFAFVTFRLLDQVLGDWHVMTDDERASTLAWSCWAIPLLVTEVVIQSRSLLKAKA